MNCAVLLVMSIVATSNGQELVSVYMPYDDMAQCKQAATAARWLYPDGYGLQAQAECVINEGATI